MKYGRIERERRFLVSRFPHDVPIIRTRQITDRYLDGTRLRLREQRDDDGPPEFKLTQKIPSLDTGAQQGFITTIYLTEPEFLTLAVLPASTLRKTRYSVPPFGIDVFTGPLEGLMLAEAEFESAAEAEALMLPPFIAHEVSTDVRFTGGRLVRASREDLAAWLAEYGRRY